MSEKERWIKEEIKERLSLDLDGFIAVLTTALSQMRDILSSTPFTPSGIWVKSSLPIAFWDTLKVQWALPATLKSPLQRWPTWQKRFSHLTVGSLAGIHKKKKKKILDAVCWQKGQRWKWDWLLSHPNSPSDGVFWVFSLCFVRILLLNVAPLNIGMVEGKYP